MKKLWDPVVKSAGDLQDTANRLLNNGLTFFRAKLGSIPLLSSSSAEIDGDRDETHYFLVPNLTEKGGYCLYRTRFLPDGIGPQNDLPKSRIFQLPASGTADHLTDLLSRELKEQQLQSANFDSPLANRLDAIADEIDHQSNLVSGGLILVGGVVAITNPLLGAGIAVKSLIPGLGSKISIHGVKHASDWLKSRKKQSLEKEAGSSAHSKVKKLKPEIRENRVLALLEQTLNSSSGDFDPMIASGNLFSNPEDSRDIRLAAQAVSTVYEERGQLSPPLYDWIKHLDDLASQ